MPIDGGVETILYVQQALPDNYSHSDIGDSHNAPPEGHRRFMKQYPTLAEVGITPERWTRYATEIYGLSHSRKKIPRTLTAFGRSIHNPFRFKFDDNGYPHFPLYGLTDNKQILRQLCREFIILMWSESAT